MCYIINPPPTQTPGLLSKVYLCLFGEKIVCNKTGDHEHTHTSAPCCWPTIQSPEGLWKESSFCFMTISHFSMLSRLSWKLSWSKILSSLSRTFTCIKTTSNLLEGQCQRQSISKSKQCISNSIVQKVTLLYISLLYQSAAAEKHVTCKII